MPSGNLLGLGKKSGKGFEQEEVTSNSFSPLLVEEAFSFFQERVLWMLPLLRLKRLSVSNKESFGSSLAEFEEERNSSSLTLTLPTKL